MEEDEEQNANMMHEPGEIDGNVSGHQDSGGDDAAAHAAEGDGNDDSSEDYANVWDESTSEEYNSDDSDKIFLRPG